MDTAVSAEDMAQLETEFTEAKASFKEERRFLIAEIKELNAERDRPREENKLLKAAQKISEERDEQLIQEARSLQSLGAILAAYDVAVKTRNRLKTELEAMTSIAEKWEADALRYARNAEYWQSRAEKAEAALAAAVAERDRLRAETESSCKVLRQDAEHNAARAEKAEAELASEREKVRMLTNNLRDLITAVTYADPPKLFGDVLCHEARVPVGFVDSSREALATTKESCK